MADDLLHLDRALTPQERRKLFHAPARKHSGYAAAPGTGPAGETCRSCKHYTHTVSGARNTFRKCGLMRSAWTHGPGTDIKAGSPACSKWERA